MVWKIVAAWSLMAVCVVVHAFGVTIALRRTVRYAGAAQTFGRWVGVFIAIAAWIVLLHVVEIAAWAILYTWRAAMPDLPSALYFSAVTYTTTGYGDLLPPPQWRLVAGVEALTGILMCGWSTGFFFAFVSRTFDVQQSAERR
jgi:voltage-gated potassium channel Kch